MKVANENGRLLSISINEEKRRENYMKKRLKWLEEMAKRKRRRGSDCLLKPVRKSKKAVKSMKKK